LLQLRNQGGFSQVGDDQLITCPGDADVGQTIDLLLGPALIGFEGIQSEEKDTGEVQPLGAVYGGYGDAVGGDVVRVLGAVVFREPFAEDAY